MPLTLHGSCRCGAVRFDVDTHTPVPYQHCYCSVCRKTAGGGGYAINLGALADSLHVDGWEHVEVYQARIGEGEACETSPGERHFCARCATPLWLYDPRWPDLLHPFASAIDGDLPTAPARVHLMLGDKPDWVPLPEGADEEHFTTYPALSLADWHKARGLWVD